MKNKLLLILLVTLIKGLIWLFLTPIFQIPDEPSHFSFIQFIAENNRLPHPRRELVSTQELMDVAKVVNFNWEIEHPVWRGLPINWVNQIEKLTLSTRQEYLLNPYLTSLKRPGLYYFLASLIYRVFNGQTFLWRFFAVRLFSLICQLVTVWLTFLLTQKLFKKIWLSLAVAAGVSLQPGFSFIASGASYESLAILISTLFFYLAVSRAKTIWLLLIGILGILVKPDLFFLLLLLPFLMPKKIKFLTLGIFIAVFIGLNLTLPVLNQTIRGQYPWLNRFLYFLPLKDYSVYADELVKAVISGQLLVKTVEYFKLFFQIHWHQIFAWYWGVFGWLEKTLPLSVYPVLKILTILSFFGLIKTWRRVKFLLLAVFLQALIIIGNDWLVFFMTNQIYGIQGRYFYPAISAQMILFVYGLNRFISPKLLIVGAVLLNLIGLFSLFQYFGNVWF